MCRVCLHVCDKCLGFISYNFGKSYFCSGHFWGTCDAQMLWVVKRSLLCNACIQQRLIDFVYGYSEEPDVKPAPQTLEGAGVVDGGGGDILSEALTLSLTVRPVSGDAYELEAQRWSDDTEALFSDVDINDDEDDDDDDDEDANSDQVEENNEANTGLDGESLPQLFEVRHSFSANGHGFHRLQTGAVRFLLPRRLSQWVCA